MRSIEAQIARQCIADLIEAGCRVSVYDGEETTVSLSRDPDAIFAAMGTTDEDWLVVYGPSSAKRRGWVRFIYGNDPEWYVINDLTVGLQEVIARTDALIDQLDNANATGRAA